MHFDSEGILGQIQSDGSIEGGDSANWMGHYTYLNNEKRGYVYLFEVGFGAYIRHPDPEKTNNGFGAYYKNPWNGCISRDQMTGIIAALIAQKDYWGIFRLMVNHSFRLFLFSYNTIHNGKDPNTSKWKFPDVTGPDIWAMELRGFGKFSWIFWPLLNILDLHLFLSSIYSLFRKSTDPISFVMKLIVCKEHIPTFTSLLAWHICRHSVLVSQLHAYWCGWRDGCDMVPLYAARLKSD